ncbi:MAG TPA: YfiR family protein [Pseudomonadales bacterium]
MISTGVSKFAMRLGVFAAATVVAASHCSAQGSEPIPVAAARAGFILNFLRFTEWPDSVFAGDSSAVVVAVTGDRELVSTLSTLVRDERIGRKQRAVKVVEVESPAPSGRTADAEVQRTRLRNSHLAFVGPQARDRLQSVLRETSGRPVLTVSETPRFAERGGMIGLVVRDGRMTFDIAPQRIRSAGIDLSSKVLRLGRVVGEPPR